jgi:hypothetical protein
VSAAQNPCKRDSVAPSPTTLHWMPCFAFRNNSHLTLRLTSAGHKIGAHAALEPSNHTSVMDAVYIFEGCYIGLQLPISEQAQVQTHQPWSVPPGGPTSDGQPGSWGGHAVPVVAYARARLRS